MADLTDAGVDKSNAATFGRASMPASEKAISASISEADSGSQVFDAADLHDAEKRGLKLAADGHTVLVPQPTDDPDDPLNWSWRKKHAILLIVAFASFCGDFGSGAGPPCVLEQGVEWNMNPNNVNESNNLNVIMLGFGGIFWIPLIYFWGRVPVLFWSTLLGAAFSLMCTLATDYNTYYAGRGLMGFFQSSCLTIGLAFIKDMFFFHEHARKIGIWALLFFIAPYLSPLIGNFVIADYGEWRIIFWIMFALSSLCATLVLLFADETWYNRSVPQGQHPVRGARIWRVLGIWQIGAHKDNYFMTYWKALDRLRQVAFKPVMWLAVLYGSATTMWLVGIVVCSSILFGTPVAAGGYGFDARQVGYLYFCPIVTFFMGEIFGHYFNDFLTRRYIKTHKGHYQPESRLWANYLAAFTMVPGLVIIGQTLHHHLHYVALIFGWGMFVFGCITGTVALTAYVLDCYPTASGEVAAFLNFTRLAAGFSIGYFQVNWGARAGYDVSFGLQGVVCACAVLLIVILHVFGKKLREWGGPVTF